jgi:Fe-S cluster biogenesis protein NfuA
MTAMSNPLTPEMTLSEAQLKEAVELVLSEHVDRFLDSHGGAVHVKSVHDGEVELGFEGACRSCPAVSATFYSTILPAIQKIPAVKNVKTPHVNISAAAVSRIIELTRRRPTGSNSTRQKPA